MICRRITAEGFRNIASCDVTFSDGVNLLLGANAQGKTNLLEAVAMFSLGKSFRGVRETEFISFDSEYCRLGLDYSDSVRDQTLALAWSKSKQRIITHNGVKISRISDMIGLFRSVLFFPEHLNIIKEGPAMRRNFLDVAVSQLRPGYLRSLQRYNHILGQRNKLIKAAPADRRAFDSTVEFWSYQMAREAAYITLARISYLAAVEAETKKSFAEMTTGRETPGLSYVFSFRGAQNAATGREELTEAYMTQLMSNHDREIAAGATLWGVHKDDIDITLNEKNARIYCSQGQQRSLALAMKLSESAISAKDSGEVPVLLLDDVFSELDGERRDYLTDRMKNGQVIITSCSENDLPAGSVKIIKTVNGVYTEEK